MFIHKHKNGFETISMEEACATAVPAKVLHARTWGQLTDSSPRFSAKRWLQDWQLVTLTFLFPSSCSQLHIPVS